MRTDSSVTTLVFQQRNLLSIVSCNEVSWTHVLSSPEMNRPSLTGGTKANATEEELDSSQKVKRGSTKLPIQLQKEWILFNHISGLKNRLACMGLSPPPFFAGSHQRRLPTPAKQARSLTPQIAGKDKEIDKTDETNTAKTCKNSEILIPYTPNSQLWIKSTCRFRSNTLCQTHSGFQYCNKRMVLPTQAKQIIRGYLQIFY